MLNVVAQRKNCRLKGLNAIVRGFVCGTFGRLAVVYVVLKGFFLVEGNGKLIDDEGFVLVH